MIKYAIYHYELYFTVHQFLNYIHQMISMHSCNGVISMNQIVLKLSFME
jgi:hypothetical protein